RLADAGSCWRFPIAPMLCRDLTYGRGRGFHRNAEVLAVRIGEVVLHRGLGLAVSLVIWAGLSIQDPPVATSRCFTFNRLQRRWFECLDAMVALDSGRHPDP